MENSIQDDIYFDKVASDKRHKEIINALKIIAEGLKKDPPDNTVRDMIQKQMKVMEAMGKVMIAQPKPEAPIVNVSSNNDAVVAAIRTVIAKLSEDKPENKPGEWTFTVARNRAGYIESITAK